LKPGAGQIDRYGEKKLYWTLKKVAENPDGAKLTISTTHKAKGHESGCIMRALHCLALMSSSVSPAVRPFP